MIQFLMLLLLISVIISINMLGIYGKPPTRTKSIMYEEHVIAIDAAGILGGDDMLANPDPNPTVPAWARGVEEVAVLALSNGDVLGASNAWAIISGAGFPDGPHQIPLGAHGSENIDLANTGAPSTPLSDMGLRCLSGGEYQIQFMVTGDGQQDFGCSIELTFQDKSVRQPKQWVSRNVTSAVVNVDVPGVTLAGAALPNINPGNSTLIGGFIGCGAGDMAALGCHHIMCKASQGLVDNQEVQIAGVGGELIIGHGAHIPPTQRVGIAWQIKDGEPVYISFRGVIEAGIMDAAASFGFVKGRERDLGV